MPNADDKVAHPRPMCRILLTGFGPFPEVEWNPSGPLVERLSERFAGTRDVVQCSILPTAWHGAPAALEQHIVQFQPDMSLHLGVSPLAQGLKLERFAYNACDGRTDVEGTLHGASVLDPEGAAQLRTRVNLDFLTDGLARRAGEPGITLQLSDDPGRYLCNAVYYTALQHAERAPARLVLFVHLPCAIAGLGRSHTTATMCNADAVLAGLEAIVNAMIKQHLACAALA